MAFGTNTINADRVTVKRGTEEATLVSDVKVTQKRIIDTTYTRAGAIDSYRWRARFIEFTVALAKETQAQIIADATIDGRNKPVSQQWNINAEATIGSSSDSAAFTITAVLFDYDILAPANGLAQLRVFLKEVPGAN